MLRIPPGAFHGVKVNTAEPYRRYTLHFLAAVQADAVMLDMFVALEKALIYVFPDHCPQRTYANGTVDDGKSYVLTDINMSDATRPVNGTYILTKQ